MGRSKRFSTAEPATAKAPGLLARRIAKLFAAASLFGSAAVVAWAAIQQKSGEPVAADRLIVEYRLGAFKLLSSSPVLKVLPPSDELPATERPLSGFWFELQSGEGKLLYRRIIADPITEHTEAASSGPGAGPERAEAVPEEKVFAVTVPTVPGSNQLVLFSSPLGPAEKMKAAGVIARIPFASPAR